MPSDPSPLCIGIDGGGTGGRAWVGPADAVEPSGRGQVARPCNPYAVGSEAAADAVLEAVQAALADAGLDASALAGAWVCAGLAGVDRPEDGERMRRSLAARGLSEARLELTADPWVALEGALPDPTAVDAPRLLLVGGTGSVAVGQWGARQVRVGGWGSRVGDEGSGAFLGIEAVRETLRVLDGRSEGGPLAEAVQRAWGQGPEALVGRARDASSGDFGALAPAVLELADRDPAAAALRTRAVAYLAELVTTAARRLVVRNGGRLFDETHGDEDDLDAAQVGHSVVWAYAGGIASVLAPEIASSLEPELAAHLLPAAGPPVAGAWARARRAARLSEG